MRRRRRIERWIACARHASNALDDSSLSRHESLLANVRERPLHGFDEASALGGPLGPKPFTELRHERDSARTLRLYLLIVSTQVEVRTVLEQAAAFARGYDPSGAVARARHAVRMASDVNARDGALLELRELEAAERLWRAAAEARRSIYGADELERAEVDDVRASTSGPVSNAGRVRRTLVWLRAQLRREGRAALASPRG
jgi:flagellar basal body rod protein FlgC